MAAARIFSDLKWSKPKGGQQSAKTTIGGRRYTIRMIVSSSIYQIKATKAMTCEKGAKNLSEDGLKTTIARLL